MTCWLLLNEAAATFCWLTVWWAVDEPVGSWTRLVPNYWERQNYGSVWRSLLALARWKSVRKAKDCLSFRERISMSRRQRLVFLESVPSFVRCFSCALGPPNTGCHRKQTNIHLFHSFSWHLEKKEQRNSKRDDDGASRWVAAWTSTVANCYSDIQTGKRQNTWRAGDSVMFVILPLLSQQHRDCERFSFILYFQVSLTPWCLNGVLDPAGRAHRLGDRLTLIHFYFVAPSNIHVSKDALPFLGLRTSHFCVIFHFNPFLCLLAFGPMQHVDGLSGDRHFNKLAPVGSRSRMEVIFSLNTN